jgi:hypothetical protein
MATGAPGTNGVWQYGEDDSEATFSALLNKAASTTDTAIGLDRGRLTTLEARELSGLVKVAPTSVTLSGGSASIASSGTVTVTGPTTYISLNTIFTANYDHYRIILDLTATSGATEFRARLRSNTTDFAGNSYAYNFQNVNTSAYGASYATTDTSFQIARSNGANGNRITMDVTAPRLTKYTNITAHGNDGLFANLQTGALTTTTSYNGITFLTGGATTITSAIVHVYGYRN